jgi:hypothetical protein
MNTNKITSFKKADIQPMKAKVLDALAILEKELGVSFSFTGTNHYSDIDITCSLVMTAAASDGTVQSAGQVSWNKYANMYGFSSEDLGKTFISNKEKFTITGLNPNRPTYPVSAMNTKDKSYKFSADQVLSALGKTPKDDSTPIVMPGEGEKGGYAENVPEEYKKNKAAWDLYCARHGLTPNDFGRTFKDDRGAVHILIEISPKRPKNPFGAITRLRGTQYIWPAEPVKEGLI